MSKILGLLNFEPSYVNVEGLEDYRPISATSVLGRYRVIDFMLSNFTNSGIDNIKVYLKNRPRSIVEHISGTSYNINSKSGNIQMLMGEGDFSNNAFYNVDVQAFKTYMEFIKTESASYVVIAPSHFIFKQDFSEMVNYHVKSRNDITVLYQAGTNLNDHALGGDLLTIDENGRVIAFDKNRGKYKKGNLSLETYVMDAITFKNLVDEASETSSLYSLSDIIADVVRAMRVGAYQHKGYCSCVSTLKEYHETNIELRQEKLLSKLIEDSWPIYTKTSDSSPTLYREGAVVKGSIVANGCQVEGTVVDSVIGRNVVIKEGAVIKNSVILPDTFIDKNVKLENAVVDRLAIVTHIKELKGTAEKPIYIKRGDRI
ncbi:MAG: glucose-1-phosphate adenylyltransferase subunit GlgD [Erysipelotrichaceae bacterium]|nr:glucose-1-phosphate adenylyltransferase subunit GlgD [Erysipelotrichaceae bacterium]